jgi:hypothetical protein
MRKLIGYLEGTDPLWLTVLQAKGHDTTPLGNGLDNHGVNLRLLTKHNKPDLIISYLHKLVIPQNENFTPAELLLSAHLYGIPVLVVCPANLHKEARQLLAGVGDGVELVDPGEVLVQASKYINGQ